MQQLVYAETETITPERLEEYNNLKYQKEALLSMREELASELELMNAAGFQDFVDSDEDDSNENAENTTTSGTIGAKNTEIGKKPEELGQSSQTNNGTQITS